LLKYAPESIMETEIRINSEVFSALLWCQCGCQMRHQARQAQPAARTQGCCQRGRRQCIRHGSLFMPPIY
jgi:hypothetical protein